MFIKKRGYYILDEPPMCRNNLHTGCERMNDAFGRIVTAILAIVIVAVLVTDAGLALWADVLLVAALIAFLVRVFK